TAFTDSHGASTTIINQHGGVCVCRDDCVTTHSGLIVDNSGPSATPHPGGSMKSLRLTILFLSMAVLASVIMARQLPRNEKFNHNGNIAKEAPSSWTGFDDRKKSGDATEAPTGFDNLTNGFDEQGMAYDKIDSGNVMPLRSFN